MITKIKLLTSKHNLKRGLTIDNIEPLTLIVGGQCSGKSSLLSLFVENDIEKIKVDVSGPIKSLFFDFEKDNPTTKDKRMFTDVNGMDVGIGLADAVITHYQSHGETLIDYSINNVEKASDYLFIFDEPETALSPQNQYKMVEVYKQAAEERNCQFIIATHNIPLIQSVNLVFNMDILDWQTSDEYLTLR